MLPSVLARQVQRGLADYIETTFPMTNSVFQGSIAKMLTTDGAVFREPYTAVRLPFRSATEQGEYFESISLPFAPYVHQHRAFARLTGDQARSTLVATGTGSGKTECFLLPILEYCYQHRGEPGIKVLIIYPMNALAADQAERLAKEIYNNAALRGHVSAGMYVGGKDAMPSQGMGEKHVITDRETILNSPPDILLTNYKMLDYLLIRPKDARLWRDNGPETLKFIIVDELHTFDGAQGTDLACLLRRLKARLSIPAEHLACVGTSATMGSDTSTASIRQYAEKIFGEPFDEDAVITEDRIRAAEYFATIPVTDQTMPTSAQTEALHTAAYEAPETDYLQLAAQAWLQTPPSETELYSELGRNRLRQQLREHEFVQGMLKRFGSDFVQPSTVMAEMEKRYPEVKAMAYPLAAYDALIALISHARIYHSDDQLRPFLQVQVQVWLRELTRMLGRVDAQAVSYALESDLNEEQRQQYLPVINCRDCGETGWIGLMDERQQIHARDLSLFYNLFFRQHGNVRMVFPREEAEPSAQGHREFRFCPSCHGVHAEQHGQRVCAHCQDETIPVWLPELEVSGSRENKRYQCPFCGSGGGLSLIGLRAATAISSLTSLLYTSSYNDDRKLLAFSDNVQDAAHRAGFFNARTWRFVFRSALQQYIQEQGDGASLRQFAQDFSSFWRSQQSVEQYLTWFTAPNLTWHKAYEAMRSQGVFKENSDGRALLEWVEKRLEYEVYLEFGLSSRTGRTLEKSGCAVIGWEPEPWQQVLPRIQQRLRNELGELRDIPTQAVTQMVLGWTAQLRRNGAFALPVFESYRYENGNDYLLTNAKLHWAPGLRPGLNTPQFLTRQSNGRVTDFKNRAWFERWLDRIVHAYLPDSVLRRAELPREMAQILLEELSSVGLLHAKTTKNEQVNWGLNPDHLRLSQDVHRYRCERCGTTTSVAAAEGDFWSQMPCMRTHCSGTLILDSSHPVDFYGRLFQQGDIVRIFAYEHTGLLDRETREQLEASFKRSGDERLPWDANLLSCTPTLEMGIDIGDLSTVVLCSVPPGQAQYLQRVGRAGRTTGNMLALTVANAQPHDLYFYAKPEEMLAGLVQPPEVFLNASAVLERQFTAFCFDRWVQDGADLQAIPQNVRACLSKWKKPVPSVFPFNLLQYIKVNLETLFADFTTLFQNELTPETMQELERFAKGSGTTETPLSSKILTAFRSLYEHRESLRDNVRSLNKALKELEAKPKDSSHDSELEALQQEKRAITGVIRSIDNKNVFNFLTDEGLLPNYAFPEAGIVLKAILHRKEQGKPYEDRLVYEYQRSASAALGEFAPANSFYAEGRKLTIDQVDMATSETAKWRLCPNCSYAALDTVDTPQDVCPRCGSRGWSDTGQVRSMLRMQMVYSHGDYADSMIGDDSEERSRTFYSRSLLVDVDEEQDVVAAYRTLQTKVPFGYEFVQKAVIRDINFGERDLMGERVTISGHEDVRKGFKVCRYCGRVQSGDKPIDHARTCPVRRQTKAEQEQECLFLFREFATEALRILIPATSMDTTTAQQESFVAAFMLGMKEYFGNVDHLRSTISEVPIMDTAYTKQYLVVYDSVPGGTGYLKQLLTTPTALLDMFQKAWDVLKDCACEPAKEKDGCYRCLFAYRQSRQMNNISKKVAQDQIRQILQGRDRLVPIAGLKDISVNALFESELERQLIAALEKLAAQHGAQVKKQVVNGKEGFLLQRDQVRWDIEPQVELDQGQGVQVHSRADFVFWPRSKQGHKRPVAVFTDGFTYHKANLTKDIRQRLSLLQSEQFRTWVLTYQDVDIPLTGTGSTYCDALNWQANPGGQLVPKLLAKWGQNDLNAAGRLSLELLLQYLMDNETEERFAANARAHALSLLDFSQGDSEEAYSDWWSMLEPITQGCDWPAHLFRHGSVWFGYRQPGGGLGPLHLLAAVDRSSQNPLKMEPAVIAYLNDQITLDEETFHKDWQTLWQYFNVIQFHEHFTVVNSSGLHDGSLIGIAEIWGDRQLMEANGGPTTEESSALNADEDPAWQEVWELCADDEALLAVAQRLRRAGLPAPSELGFVLTDQRNAVVAEAEMVWEDHQIAWLRPDQQDQRSHFERAGWDVIDELDAVTQSLFQGGTGE